MKTLKILITTVLLMAPTILWADGDFSKASKIDTKHFSIYCQPGVDINKLVGQLSTQTVNGQSGQVQLSALIENLFSKTSDILDTHVYSMKTDIKIYAAQQDLADFYDKTFHEPLPNNLHCFFLNTDRTIYMSAEYVQGEILGAEMGRAIMNSYFVVEPSIGIQKILTGYVQYQLHKTPVLLN